MSTFGTTLMPIDLILLSAFVSSSKARFGSMLVTSRPAASTHFFSSAERLCQSLSLTQRMALFASCSEIESTGATS